MYEVRFHATVDGKVPFRDWHAGCATIRQKPRSTDAFSGWKSAASATTDSAVKVFGSCGSTLAPVIASIMLLQDRQFSYCYVVEISPLKRQILIAPIAIGIPGKEKTMPSVPYDDVMADIYRGDPAYALAMLNSILEDGKPGELLIALRQMTKAFGGMQRWQRRRS